ncbi:MAG: cytochrome C [Balneola sp.]|nr:MAG: cytochrome C [Balneola sp.]
MLQKILLGLLGVFLIMQIFQIDRTNPESDPALDLMNIHNPPAEVATILKTACYDCHSDKTVYPWYTYVQPVGWWVKDHVDHGKSHLNFSTFGEYPPRRADHKLEEGVEYTLNEEMPLPSYTWGHADARLTDEQRETLADWFESLRPIVYPDSLNGSDS